MNATTAPIKAASQFKEDRVRADCYALIARLFHAGPDEELLASIELADEIASAGETIPLAATWRALAAAAAAMDAKTARAEYDSVFVGADKAERTPYVSHHLAEAMTERLLVRLRGALAQIGLVKRELAAEHQDQFAGLCEAMHQLIAAGSGDAATREQKALFSTHIGPGYTGLCAAVEASPNTNFYKYVARFTRAFLDLEAESFDAAK